MPKVSERTGNVENTPDSIIPAGMNRAVIQAVRYGSITATRFVERFHPSICMRWYIRFPETIRSLQNMG